MAEDQAAEEYCARSAEDCFPTAAKTWRFGDVEFGQREAEEEVQEEIGKDEKEDAKKQVDDYPAGPGPQGEEGYEDGHGSGELHGHGPEYGVE